MATADGIGVIGRGKSHIRIGGDHEKIQLLGEANPALRGEGTIRYENPLIHEFSQVGGGIRGAALPSAA